MPRNRSPILGKAWDLIALSISPMAKVKKPFARKLLFKKTKRFELIKHCNYAYMREYEFSPSSTPLFRPAGGAAWKKKKKKKKRVQLLSLLCGGDYGAESVAEGDFVHDLEMLSPRADADRLELEEDVVELPEFGEEEEEDDGDASVDQRAERFIEKFYEEIRIQRQNSFAKYREMLLNGYE